MKYIFFGAWLTAGATIENIFNSKGAMMTFVIAMIVIIATAWGDGKDNKIGATGKYQFPRTPRNI